MLWGAWGGMLGGLAATSLYYLYEQRLAYPGPYNSLTLFLGGPMFVTLGAFVGLLAAAWYCSD
jgi:hypothetical protein